MIYDKNGYDSREVTALIRWSEKARMVIESSKGERVCYCHDPIGLHTEHSDYCQKLTRLIEEAKGMGI